MSFSKAVTSIGLLFIVLAAVSGTTSAQEASDSPAEIEPPKPGMGVAEFVEAYYDTYVIDTSGAEPTVLSVIATNGDFSELEAMGVSTKGVFLDTVYPRMPVRLIDSVRQLPTVLRLRFMTWEERVLGMMGSHTAIDTAGGEALMSVTIVVEGDIAELKAAGLDVPDKAHMGKYVFTKVPVRRMREIRKLKCVRHIIPSRADLQLQDVQTDQSQLGQIDGRLVNTPRVPECRIEVDLTWVPRSSDRPGDTELRRTWTIQTTAFTGGQYVLDSLQPGIYTCSFRLLDIAEENTELSDNGGPARDRCHEVTIEGIRVPVSGLARDVVVDFRPTALDGIQGGVCDPCRSTWKAAPVGQNPNR